MTVETVTKLEKADKVHYIPHLAVVRREAAQQRFVLCTTLLQRLGSGGHP